MRESRALPGVKKVLVASGVRMDLARTSPEYLRELTAHHVGGKLKVAPEHVDEGVLSKMRKPKNNDFEYFTEVFNQESERVCKKQFNRSYFIASHPGSDVNAMRFELALFSRNATVTNPMPCRTLSLRRWMSRRRCITRSLIHSLRSRVYRQSDEGAQMQRALMQSSSLKNYFEVREALREADVWI